MKILYAIQATGNGHIARAIELLPYLQQYSTVDIFLSGSNSSLSFDLPVKYRSKGLSLFYGNRGGLNYWKMTKEFSPLRICKEARDLPVEKYDIVINDFESITSLACKLKNIPFLHFGHQASFTSLKTPRPVNKVLTGEFLLKYYVSSPHKIGLHFDQYDTFIHSPVIKKTVLNAEPVNHGHVTVYLSHFNDEILYNQLSKIKDIEFQIFSKKVLQKIQRNNITFLRVDNNNFNESMISSAGIITGAGFETPAEALYLNKKLMCIPIQGQYEQLCNAAALEKFRVPVLNKLNDLFPFQVQQWMNDKHPEKLLLDRSTQQIIEEVIEMGISLKKNKITHEYPGIVTPSDIAFA